MVNISKLSNGEKFYWDTNYAKDGTEDRIILLFDMDAFEVQVHQKDWMKKDEPPRVVVNFKNRILAVSYEAKQLGINRTDTPYFRDAQKLCPNLERIDLPLRKNGRSNASVALEASGRIVASIRNYLRKHHQTAIFEFASNDEFFVDITRPVNKMCKTWKTVNHQLNDFWENTYIYNNAPEGHPYEKYECRLERFQAEENRGWRDIPSLLERQEVRLMLGSTIANKIVEAILKDTTYQSSVGIGSNKLMAKIASSVHKPGAITIAAPSGFWKFSKQVSLKKIPGLGGEVGNAIAEKYPNGTQAMARIQRMKKFQLTQLISEITPNINENKMAVAFKNAAFGLCSDPVIKSHCYRTSNVERIFRGGDKFVDVAQFRILLEEQCEEMKDKLDFERSYNRRCAKQLKILIKFVGEPSVSRTVAMHPACGLKYIRKQFLPVIHEVPRKPVLDSIKISANF